MLPSLSQITVEELGEYLSQGDTQTIQLIDVREPQEVALASLPGFNYYPLSQFGDWSETISNQLDPHKETWVLCHHGIRSAQMSQWLVTQKQFQNVKNIVGGIDAYSHLVDPSIPHY